MTVINTTFDRVFEELRADREAARSERWNSGRRWWRFAQG
jgi:hypothetical protein